MFEEVGIGEDKETDSNPLEHTDIRQTGEHKEKTEAGKVNADQMEKEQLEECSEARTIKRLAHTIVLTISVMPTGVEVGQPSLFSFSSPSLGLSPGLSLGCADQTWFWS